MKIYIAQMNVVQGKLALNFQNIKKLVAEAESKEASLVVFPELCVTGYTCGDLFSQDVLLKGCENAVEKIIEETEAEFME